MRTITAEAQLLAGVATAVEQAFQQGVWITAEVVRVDGDTQVYLELAERDAGGTLIIDVYSRAVLGYHVSLNREYSRYDVIRTMGWSYFSCNLVRFGAKAVARQALAVHLTVPRAVSRNFLISLSVLTSGVSICAKSTTTPPSGAVPATSPDVDAFLKSLSTAWRDGEARPTHRKQPGAKHWWRTKVDPFADAWPLVDGWLIAEPSASAKELMNRLAAMFPEAYAGNAQLRTLQRQVKAWRAERAKDMILGRLRKSTLMPAEV